MSVFDVIEHSPVSKFHRKLLLACCGGPFLDGYILSLIGIALIGFGQDIAATHCQAAIETVECGHIARLQTEHVPRDS